MKKVDKDSDTQTHRHTDTQTADNNRPLKRRLKPSGKESAYKHFNAMKKQGLLLFFVLFHK